MVAHLPVGTIQPNKSRGWVTTRYSGKFHKSNQDRWVFGDGESGANASNYGLSSRHLPSLLALVGGESHDDLAHPRLAFCCASDAARYEVGLYMSVVDSAGSKI